MTPQSAAYDPLLIRKFTTRRAKDRFYKTIKSCLQKFFLNGIFLVAVSLGNFLGLSLTIKKSAIKAEVLKQF
jgi:hypothetical protein